MTLIEHVLKAVAKQVGCRGRIGLFGAHFLIKILQGMWLPLYKYLQFQTTDQADNIQYNQLYDINMDTKNCLIEQCRRLEDHGLDP